MIVGATEVELAVLVAREAVAEVEFELLVLVAEGLLVVEVPPLFPFVPVGAGLSVGDGDASVFVGVVGPSLL